jgi:hypothetical protein
MRLHVLQVSTYFLSVKPPYTGQSLRTGGSLYRYLVYKMYNILQFQLIYTYMYMMMAGKYRNKQYMQTHGVFIPKLCRLNNNSIQLFIIYYLCAESTATRSITNIAQRIYNSNNNNNNTIIIIQFNSCLFTCKLNSPEANYRVSTSKRKKHQNNTNKIKTREYTQ